jgi:hypothetical protein
MINDQSLSMQYEACNAKSTVLLAVHIQSGNGNVLPGNIQSGAHVRHQRRRECLHHQMAHR